VRKDVLFHIPVMCGQETGINELSHEGSLQNFYMESLRDGFVGRKTLLKQCLSTLKSCDSGILVVTGKHGSGKSSLMVEPF